MLGIGIGLLGDELFKLLISEVFPGAPNNFIFSKLIVTHTYRQ